MSILRFKKIDKPNALLIESKLLKDRFILLLNKNFKIKSKYPIYTWDEIKILMNAENDKLRIKLHQFKKQFPYAIIKKG
ncbi:MAG: hypothetical protein ACP5JE_05920 [Thermoplasmata archaeon]